MKKCLVVATAIFACAIAPFAAYADDAPVTASDKTATANSAKGVPSVAPTPAARPSSPRQIVATDIVPLLPITVGPYKYDAAGNIIHMGSDRYTYDEMSRIISGTAVTSQNADTQQFEYDGFGNLKKVTVPNKSILYIDAVSATNKLKDTAGSETGTNVLHMWGGGYDAAGNQQAANSTPSYAYDSMNMMSEMTVPRHEIYIYDANDERVATVGYTDTQNSVWRYTLRDEGNHVLRAVTDTVLNGAHSWQQTEDYVYRVGGLLAAIAPLGSGETRKHLHLDHLGSVVLITDDNGKRLSSHKYWPFGADAPGSDVDGERMKFTGHERDLGVFDPNGLDYMHARFYNPSTSRFLSVDPELNSSEAIKIPQSWNRYAYVRNNALNAVDPNGKATVVFIVDAGTDDAKEMVGHAAIYVTSKGEGAGVSAYGDDWFQHGEMGFIQHYTSAGRGVHTYVLDTTPDEDATMLKFIKDHPSEGSGKYNVRYNGGIDENKSIVKQNCTTACVNVMKAGGLTKKGAEPGKMLGMIDRPKTLQNSLEKGSLNWLVKAIRFFAPKRTDGENH